MIQIIIQHYSYLLDIQIKSLNAILIQEIPKELKIEFFENIITVIKKEETRLANQKYGLIRSLIFNMILGVEKNFEKGTRSSE